MDTRARAHSKAALAATILILFLAISLLMTAYDYGAGSGLFLRLIGWIFVALALLELSFQIRKILNPAISGAKSSPGKEIVSKEIGGFLWIGLFLVMLYLTGFMIAIPLYIFAFLRLSARRKLWESAVLAASAVLFINLLFVQLMHYQLYSGILLGN